MILVTGGTGHIGNVLVKELVARGKNVRVLILPGEDPSPLAGLDIELVQGNILDIDILRKAMEGVTLVYHLAGIISIMPGKDELLYRVNVLGTRNILQAALEGGIKRLVYTSSIHALSRISGKKVIDETVPFEIENAVGEYDRTKAQASMEVLKAVEKGLDAVIVCPTGVIGPYDYRQSEMGQMIMDCARNRQMVFVDGAYDFVDVRDVARGQILAGENGKTGETYILSGERITVEKLIDLVSDASGIRIPRIRLPFWAAQGAAIFTPFYYKLTGKKPQITPYSLETLRSNSHISHAKAGKELGYAPRSIRELIADTIEWLRLSGRLLPKKVRS